MKHDVKIIGHRGLPTMFPENSLIGFRQAVELGIDGIELDVHVSKDGEVIVHHDETIDRMTNGTGWISKLTLAELRAYRLRMNRIQRRLTTERIPTLKEVLTLLEPYPNMLVNIELKTELVLYEQIERRVLDIVSSFTSERDVIYSSFHLPTLIRLKQLQRDAQVALITRRIIPHMADFLHTFQLDGIHPRIHDYVANEQKFAECDGVRPWTVNRRRHMTRLLKQNINAIITKYPKKALQIREQLRNDR